MVKVLPEPAVKVPLVKLTFPETCQVFADAPVKIVPPVVRKETSPEIVAAAELIEPFKVAPTPVFWIIRFLEIVCVPESIVTGRGSPPELKILTPPPYVLCGILMESLVASKLTLELSVPAPVRFECVIVVVPPESSSVPDTASVEVEV